MKKCSKKPLKFEFVEKLIDVIETKLQLRLAELENLSDKNINGICKAKILLEKLEEKIEDSFYKIALGSTRISASSLEVKGNGRGMGGLGRQKRSFRGGKLS